VSGTNGRLAIAGTPQADAHNWRQRVITRPPGCRDGNSYEDIGIMNAQEISRRARAFLIDAVARLRRLPIDTMRAWPDHPPSPDFDLGVPAELLEARCRFTLMKDTLASGDIQIAIQYWRKRSLGFSQVMADGFVITLAGTLEPLSQQAIWDLT
jgi:hypothetical protein